MQVLCVWLASLHHSIERLHAHTVFVSWTCTSTCTHSENYYREQYILLTSIAPWNISRYSLTYRMRSVTWPTAHAHTCRVGLFASCARTHIARATAVRRHWNSYLNINCLVCTITTTCVSIPKYSLWPSSGLQRLISQTSEAPMCSIICAELINYCKHCVG